MEHSAQDRQSSQQIVHWLREAHGGSQEALGQALEAYRRYLLSVAGRKLAPELRSKGGASDIVQETLLDAHRNFEDFRGASPVELLGWLNQILLNRLAKFARGYRTGKRSLNRERPLDEAAHPDVAEKVAAPPVESILRRERAEAVAQALRQLPTYYREVITLRHEERLPFEEIARLLGRSEAAIRKAWARGLEQLRQQLCPSDSSSG